MEDHNALVEISSGELMLEEYANAWIIHDFIQKAFVEKAAVYGVNALSNHPQSGEISQRQ